MRYSTSYADPGLKMWDTFACATANILTHFIRSIAVLGNVPPDAGLQKRATFSTLNVGLAGIGNRTRATCVASSGTIRSAIHYAFGIFTLAKASVPLSGIKPGLLSPKADTQPLPLLKIQCQIPLFNRKIYMYISQDLIHSAAGFIIFFFFA
jgi:hypothetical protein